MNELEIFKALSNPIRLNIIKWLKEPQNNFPHQGLHVPEGDRFDRSVCVGSICEKTQISQSTISHYLDMMQRAGLLESRRFGKWTYYRRNERNISRLSEFIRNSL
ncbi:ArsR/SmtB family transcription factor [Dialister hominis]|uniref:ArsR/SmtB family transcription factor n=1 Tax=Dialister hominis TaxID=2582419 RepID=UPI00265EE89C|nr:metalloregulator ArsR/SmtB family transcription factor [uncultured Dialister sp.]